MITIYNPTERLVRICIPSQVGRMASAVEVLYDRRPGFIDIEASSDEVVDDPDAEKELLRERPGLEAVGLIFGVSG
ncbi:hypothetical protein [Rhizobium oryzicola]|uniref:Uncharacterized protein n=1 Tax=Rhizobium oryzicola TaxID=1232668 RepID=A0ABT8SRB9_9HYPH|nr:hypothetical protein [Rhizobium oryzicola]MDO1580911.1 hypothetical protein [Rhizobium oryzicola]